MIKEAITLKWIINSVMGMGLALLTFLLGDFNRVLQILMFFLVTDYITGIAASIITGELNSQKGIRGLVKKLLFIVLVAVAYQLDKLLGTNATLKTAAEWMLVINEGISITENLGRAGVPIPRVITDKLKQLKEENPVA